MSAANAGKPPVVDLAGAGRGALSTLVSLELNDARTLLDRWDAARTGQVERLVLVGTILGAMAADGDVQAAMLLADVQEMILCLEPLAAQHVGGQHEQEAGDLGL